MRRAILSILTALLVFTLAPAQNPRSGRAVVLEGLKSAGSITRDIHGIAHVRANHDYDLYFLNGYVHAQDRLFQMDVSRRRAGGTLAELFGPAVLAGDVEFRTLGLRRAAEASLEGYSPMARRVLTAYARGVNAWVAGNPLPPEYALLEITTFEPWTELDSLAVVKLIAFGLSFDLDDIRNSEVLNAYLTAEGMPGGFDPFALFGFDLFRVAPFDPATTVPDSSVVSPMTAAPTVDAAAEIVSPAPLSPGLIRQAGEVLDRFRQDDYLRKIADRDLGSQGSNQWAVAGEHTVTGRPLMANDPHLALDVPTTFYPLHLNSNGQNVMGNCFAGVPGIVIGHNDYIAWGATVNPMDVTDVYFEQVIPDETSPSGLSTVFMGAPEHLIPVPEAFFFNQPGNGVPDDLVQAGPATGVPAVTLIAPRRNMGPIISLDMETGEALSVQYTGFGPTRELDTFLLWNRARDLDSFIHGLQFFDFGSQNWVYSDIHGNIAYHTSAEMPIREDLQAMTVTGAPPYFIRDGVNGGNEWLPVQNPQPGQALPFEILPPAEMPHTINPAAGWFINANNDPAGNTLDNDPLNQLRPGGGIYYLSPGYDGFRGGRLTQILQAKLAGGGKVSLDDMKAMQADVTLIDAQVFTPHIVMALDRAMADGATAELAAFAADPAVAEAVGRLAAWDFTTPTGIPEGFDAADENGVPAIPTAEEMDASVAATLYAVWRGRMITNTIDATMARYGLPGPPSTLAVSALRNMLDIFPVMQGYGGSGLNFFHVEGVDDAMDRRDILILQSLADSLDLLAGEPFEAAFGLSTDQNDYRWGKLHRIVFDHPLGGPFNIPPAFDAFPAPLEGLRGIPTDGGFGVPDASHHNSRAASTDAFMFGHGPNNRFVAESEPRGMRAESVWPGGASGMPGPFYANLLPLWLTNDTIPLFLRHNDLVWNTLSVIKFVPDNQGRHRGTREKPGKRR